MDASNPAARLRRPLVPAALAMAAGIAVDRWFGVGMVGWWVAVAVWVGWLVCWRRGHDRSAASLLLVAIAAGGAGWSHAGWRLFDRNEVGRLAEETSSPICLTAIAADAPSRVSAPEPDPFRAIPQGDKTTLPLVVTAVRDDSRWRPATGRLELVVDGHAAGYRAGDRLLVFGQLRGGGEPLNPGQFDFRADARSDRRLATLRTESPDCITLTQQGARWSVWRTLGAARAAAEKVLARRLGPERAPVASAMLLGSRDAVNQDRSEAFRRTGSLHVLVVSGLHVGLVVSLLLGASRQGWLRRTPTLLVVMGLIVLYVLLTGARPPAVRAAVLGEVLCVAALAGRRLLAMNSLAAAAMVVLALNPADLFRAGLQLSFLAAATLIALSNSWFERTPPTAMERLLTSVQPWYERAARGIVGYGGMVLLATLVVWVASAPLLATRFHILSPIAVPISLAVFPLVAASVISGLALVLAEVVAPPLAIAVAPVCGAAIDGLQATVAFADAAPAGWLWLGGPAGWWTLGFYGLFGAAILLRSTRRLWSRLAKLSAAWVVVGVAVSLTTVQPQGLRCSFIAVGHGCSVLVETPTGETLLYDAGSLGSPGAAAETIAGVLWSKGIRRIDAMVISHADVDHFNAVPGLLDRFAVGGVYVSPAMFAETAERPNSAPAGLLRRIDQAGVARHELRQGDRLTLGEASALVLHPIDEAVLGSDNAKSLVLGIEYAGRRVLLPGDLEGEGLEEVTGQFPYDCDLLLAPHHGSARSDPPGFAAWSTPEWVVVSGGNPSYGAAAGRTYRQSGARVLATAGTGMATFELSLFGVAAESFLTD
ncbi:MAG: ComEC/Rec2 family competence protein [Planctomycetota bacterium]